MVVMINYLSGNISDHGAPYSDLNADGRSGAVDLAMMLNLSVQNIAPAGSRAPEAGLRSLNSIKLLLNLPFQNRPASAGLGPNPVAASLPDDSRGCPVTRHPVTCHPLSPASDFSARPTPI